MKLKNTQFLVESDLTFRQFFCLVRKTYATNIKSNEAMFCMVNNTLPPNSTLLSELYARESEADGVLYIYIKKESTFG